MSAPCIKAAIVLRNVPSEEQIMGISSVSLVTSSLFGLLRVKTVWDRVLALTTFLIGFASLLAPGEK